MKTLYLLRHAKSSWSDPARDDFDRPLSGRGRKAAAVMGAYCRLNRIVPALVLCSAARRTRETLELFDQARGEQAPARFQKGLYLATPSRMLAAARAVEDGVDSVLLIGHEPGIRHLALDLAADGQPEPMRRLKEKYPTGALAIIDFAVGRWKDVEPSGGTLKAFVRPRDLAD